MLKVFNTLSGQKEELKPLKENKVNLFVCGPTVYDSAHLGHARTYLAFDMIAKYLKAQGFKVNYLQNITDIDDKIIQRAKEKNISTKELAQTFEKEYLADMKSLKIDSVTKYARATDHIKEIISQIKRLKEKGFAYQAKDGIYYDIAKFKTYGQLAKRTVEQAEDGVSRIDEAQDKRNKGDFCLWKFSKEGEPSWPSPFGQGRPGWHIEDTAIAEKYFGLQYDIHGGARDLVFPHHEAEIAQMEAISGKNPMVKYWLHTGFLTAKSQKMSKSLGNFTTIKEFLTKESPRLLRFFMLKHLYRSAIDWSEESLYQAKKELEKIDSLLDKCQSPDSKLKNLSLNKEIINTKEKEFNDCMADDFNTPQALAVLFEFSSKTNSCQFSKNDSQLSLKFLKGIDQYLGFIFWPKEKTPKKIMELVKQREKQRKENKWSESDETRKEIQRLGWQVEDTSKGSKLKRI
jgi:cysteinyl-tRNA synthetase